MNAIDSVEEWNSIYTEEWINIISYPETKGFVATHKLKVADNISRTGIAAEVNACNELAMSGKQVLRLPENVLSAIDDIIIDGKKYRELLKFKPGEIKPRGYPDAYFDGQTWDFKAPLYNKVESIRKLIKDGRKADNIIFIVNDKQNVDMIERAIKCEIRTRTKNHSWAELPNIFYLTNGRIVCIWEK